MPARRRGIAKGTKWNPLISLTSTDAERLSHQPLMLIGSKKRQFPTVLDWLKHLESPNTQRGQPKLPKVRARDLAALEKFWKVAQARGLVRKLIADPRMSNFGIAKRVRSKHNIKVSGEAVRLIRKSWDAKLKTFADRIILRDARVLAHFEEYPDKRVVDIARDLNFTAHEVLRALKRAGISPRQLAKERSARERTLRKGFLDRLQVHYPLNSKLGTPIAKMAARYLHMLKKHEYEVLHYDPFLKLREKKLDTSIAMFEQHRVDWRDYDKGLWKLIGASPQTLGSKLELFSTIGASPELHYLLLKKWSNRFAHYESERAPYPALRKAVVENNVPAILEHSGSIAGYAIRLNSFSYSPEYFDAAKDAALNVHSNCRHPEKNPALFLTLVSCAADAAVHNQAIKFAVEKHGSVI